MGLKRVLVTIALLGCGVGLAFCSDGGSGKADAGRPPSADRGPVPDCIETFDCVEGDCKEGKCVKCTANSCTAGLVCSGDFKCVACTGACLAGDAAVVSCTKRDDCPSGQICRNSKCQAPDPTGRCIVSDECVTGQVCNYSSNTCIVGCFSNQDCKGVVLDGGLPAPHCDTAVSNQCGPCVDGNDCAVGERCMNQRCEKAPECVPPDRTPCGDRACIAIDGGYACGPCAVEADCGTGYQCIGGKCSPKSTGCTADSQCKNISPGHWCDTATGQCEWGCLPPNDAGVCAPNCCTGSDTCNPATHKCGGQACADCNPPCGFGETCDTSSCTCRRGGADGGSIGPGTCDGTDCTGCPAGSTCKCMGAINCMPGIGCFNPSIPAICVED